MSLARLVHKEPRGIKALKVFSALRVRRGFLGIRAHKGHRGIKGRKAHRGRLELREIKDRLVQLGHRAHKEFKAQTVMLVLREV
jgi:hypothetical protein